MEKGCQVPKLRLRNWDLTALLLFTAQVLYEWVCVCVCVCVCARACVCACVCVCVWESSWVCGDMTDQPESCLSLSNNIKYHRNVYVCVRAWLLTDNNVGSVCVCVCVHALVIQCIVGDECHYWKYPECTVLLLSWNDAPHLYTLM